MLLFHQKVGLDPSKMLHDIPIELEYLNLKPFKASNVWLFCKMKSNPFGFAQLFWMLYGPMALSCNHPFLIFNCLIVCLFLMKFVVLTRYFLSESCHHPRPENEKVILLLASSVCFKLEKTLHPENSPTNLIPMHKIFIYIVKHLKFELRKHLETSS